MSKKENKEKGNLGENIAYSFLESKGYKIITRNFNCIYGEVDIIAKDKQDIVFIEVKTRFQNCYGAPIDAVDFNKKCHIYNVAKYFLYKYNLLEKPVRFDAIEVYIQDSQSHTITHLKNVILDKPKKTRRCI